MITPEEAYGNPELMIKHKDDLKNKILFMDPWYWVFHRYPYLYREFSDRFNKMNGTDISHALRDDPTLVLDLKNCLHKMNKIDIDWVLEGRPGLSLCMKYKDDPGVVGAAYYVGYPHELDNLNKEEKREMGKRILELLKEEKT